MDLNIIQKKLITQPFFDGGLLNGGNGRSVTETVNQGITPP